jgi:hypothetical protein
MAAVRLDLGSEKESPALESGPDESRSEGKTATPTPRPKYRTARNTCTFRYLVKGWAANRRNFGCVIAL